MMRVDYFGMILKLALNGHFRREWSLLCLIRIRNGLELKNIKRLICNE
jgi:hypothetical protein